MARVLTRDYTTSMARATAPAPAPRRGSMTSAPARSRAERAPAPRRRGPRRPRARRDDDASAAVLSLATVSTSQLAMESHQYGKRSGSNSAVSAAQPNEPLRSRLHSRSVVTSEVVRLCSGSVVAQ